MTPANTAKPPRPSSSGDRRACRSLVWRIVRCRTSAASGTIQRSPRASMRRAQTFISLIVTSSPAPAAGAIMEIPMSSPQKNEWLEAARAAMQIEAASVAAAACRLNGELIRAAELILAHSGKVVVTGIGKSGHIARKIVATLCSTGTASVFLHPAEAVHGDLGIYTPGDPTVMLSKDGTSAELLALVPLLREFRSPLIGILGNRTSPLAAQL